MLHVRGTVRVREGLILLYVRGTVRYVRGYSATCEG